MEGLRVASRVQACTAARGLAQKKIGGASVVQFDPPSTTSACRMCTRLARSVRVSRPYGVFFSAQREGPVRNTPAVTVQPSALKCPSAHGALATGVQTDVQVHQRSELSFQVRFVPDALRVWCWGSASHF